MRPSTKRLHETLIRLLKGCLKAWESWLREQTIVAEGPISPTVKTDIVGGE